MKDHNQEIAGCSKCSWGAFKIFVIDILCLAEERHYISGDIHKGEEIHSIFGDTNEVDDDIDVDVDNNMLMTMMTMMTTTTITSMLMTTIMSSHQKKM